MAGLIASYHRGDVEAVKKALASGENVNGRNGFDETPLMIAAEGGSDTAISILKLLLKHPSVEVNLAGHNGFTALMYAAKNRGSIPSVKLLRKVT